MEQCTAASRAADNSLVKVTPLLAMVGDWKAFLNHAVREEEVRDFQSTAAPVGRWGAPRFWSVWKTSSVVCLGHRKLAGRRNFANYHNEYCVPGIIATTPVTPGGRGLNPRIAHIGIPAMSVVTADITTQMGQLNSWRKSYKSDPTGP